LLASGLNHSRTALIVYLINILLVVVNLAFIKIDATWAFLLMLVVATIAFQLPVLIGSRKSAK